MSDDHDAASSPSKRRKTDAIENEVFHRFHESYATTEAVELLDLLKQRQCALAAFEISTCNAADPDYACCFDKAECTIKPTNVTVAFASLFVEPFNVLRKFLAEKEVPPDGPMRKTLLKLLTFLMNTDIQTPLGMVKNSDETDMTLLLAFHLFSQLALSPSFTLDNKKSNLPKMCPCRKHHGIINYGDTSIDVWHGRLDIIMEGAEVVIDTVDLSSESGQDDDSEVKQTDIDMTDISAGSSIAQIAAETIVYSLYQHHLHPDHENTLIPCIAITANSVMFYFYDSVKDVLLGSTLFSLLSVGANHPFLVRLTTVFALWMVLNHKHHCNGLQSFLEVEIPSANFVKVAKHKLSIFREGLRRGNVGQGYKSAICVDPSIMDSRFLITPDLL